MQEKLDTAIEGLKRLVTTDKTHLDHDPKSTSCPCPSCQARQTLHELGVNTDGLRRMSIRGGIM